MFAGDAVYLLNKNAEPQAVGMDSMDEALEMAELSDLELYIVDSALSEAGMTEQDLIEYENLKIINVDQLTDLIEQAITCFRY